MRRLVFFFFVCFFVLLLIVIIFTLKVVNLNDIIAFIQTIRFVCYSQNGIFFALISRATKMHNHNSLVRERMRNCSLKKVCCCFAIFTDTLHLIMGSRWIFEIKIHCINHERGIFASRQWRQQCKLRRYWRDATLINWELIEMWDLTNKLRASI